jgi:ADP-ribose pyrophosphatase YjhB (NUDIX family)
MGNFETDPNVIKQKLEDLRAQGFDTIHLPGGTSKDGSCSSTVVIVKFFKKEFYFVAMPYNSSAKTNGHNKKDNESPEQIARREVMEETALSIELADLHPLFDVPVKDNRPEHVGKIHRKYFYFADTFTGNLFEFKGPSPIDDGETAAPVMIPASLLMKIIFKGHLEALKTAICYLMEDKENKASNKDYAYALLSLMDSLKLM